MSKLFRRSSGPLLVVLSLMLPSAAWAQAVITGVVRDTSGAVLPGVTVEAAQRRPVAEDPSHSAL